MVTVKVTCPDASEGPEGAEMIELPPPWESETVFPTIGFELASSSVTVIVELSKPFAITIAGLAETVEAVASLLTKVTLAVCKRVLPLVVSVAV